MGISSKIQWTDATWNVAVGCTKVDEDCKYCYMYRDSLNSTRYNPMKIRKTKSVFDLPLKIKLPSKIFTSSYTDFFHPEIDSFRDDAWEIIRRCPQHTFQILTKRPERILKCLPDDWGLGYKNVWLGVSVGSNNGINRILELVNINARCRFLSLEPLWGPIDLKLDIDDLIKINWVIIGGESGNERGKYKYRECKIEWIESIIKDTHITSAIFVKQLGTYLAKELKMSDRHGGNIDEFPNQLKIRQFPILTIEEDHL